MTSAEREEILDFLQKNPMGVISTINPDGSPESALVAFAETADFEIIFQTFLDAQKYQNLKADPRMSFVAGWEIEKSKQITFQYRGDAREITREEEDYQKYRSIFERKETPCTTEFLDNPKSRMLVVSPKWFRYSDYSQETPRIVEKKFKTKVQGPPGEWRAGKQSVFSSPEQVE